VPRASVVLGVNLVVGAAGLGWLLHRFGGDAWELLLTRASGLGLAAFFLTVLLAFVAFARRWQLLLAGLDSRPGLGRLTAYRAAGQSLSSLVPSAKLGGEPLRVWLLTEGGTAAPVALTSVVIDRTLEIASSTAFTVVFAGLLVRRGVPALEGALVTVVLATVGIGVGIAVTVRRLRRGAGLVTAAARATGLGEVRAVAGRLGVVEEAEAAATRLVGDRGRMLRALGIGLLANALVLVEYRLLLGAFDLPTAPLAVVAAIFATGAAHSFPVPAAVGALEGAQMWLFGVLGHPPEVGLAVGLAVRLRELVWVVPGLLVLAARTLRRPA
jgi:uncharacterized protein (TIRG00374 family)